MLAAEAKLDPKQSQVIAGTAACLLGADQTFGLPDRNLVDHQPTLLTRYARLPRAAVASQWAHQGGKQVSLLALLTHLRQWRDGRGIHTSEAGSGLRVAPIDAKEEELDA